MVARCRIDPAALPSKYQFNVDNEAGRLARSVAFLARQIRQ
jgi:hypothetical protein